MANQTNSLAHTKWVCKYHIVFCPKYKRKIIYFPQNKWLVADAPVTWAIYRNIPFALLGILIIVLFFVSAKKNQDQEYRFMWLTIVVSFAFYIPVVLWADSVPAIGFLMMPKTCAYVWTVLIGFISMRKSLS